MSRPMSKCTSDFTCVPKTHLSPWRQGTFPCYVNEITGSSGEVDFFIHLCAFIPRHQQANKKSVQTMYIPIENNISSLVRFKLR